MKRDYLSFLLRVWKTGGTDSRNWVASLEDPHSRQVTQFRSLEALLEFLLQSTNPEGAIAEPGHPLDEEKTA